MANYKLEWKRSALKELGKLPSERILEIISAIEQLTSQPFPNGVKKLVGSNHTYRIRIGDYRVIYNVLTKILVVEIIGVGHRKEIYRK